MKTTTPLLTHTRAVMSSVAAGNRASPHTKDSVNTHISKYAMPETSFTQ